MKGLFVKDVCLAMKIQGRVFLALMAFSSVMSFVNKNPLFVVSYMAFISALFGMNSIAYDEINHGYAFLFTLPVDVKHYVASKYIFSIVMTVGTVICAFIISAIALLVQGKGSEIAFYMVPMFAILFFLIVYLSLIIPVQLHYGAEKGRMVILGITGAMTAIVVWGAKLFSKSGFSGKALLYWLLNRSLLEWVVGITLCIAVVLMLSYRVSVKVMEQKEF